MNKKVIISSDTTLDLTRELLEKYDIKTIPLTVLLGDKSFPDSPEFDNEAIFSRYREDGTLPKTSAPSLQQFTDFFRQYTDEGYEIVHLDISSELSSTCNNAKIAASEFDGVFVVDSRMLSNGVGLLAIEGAECRDKGMGAKEIAEHLESLTGKVDTSFVLDTLEFTWKGGRCSGLVAFGANLLGIKPALEMRDGKLEIYKKFRGPINKVYKMYITDRLNGRSVRPEHVFLCNSGEIPQDVIDSLAEHIRSLIEVKELHLTMSGCTITSHCGPKCLGVLFINK